MTAITPAKQPLFKLPSLKEGQTIRFPDIPIQTARQEFEENAKSGLLVKIFSLPSCALPLAISLHIASGQKSLSTIFGTVAVGIASTLATTYVNYRAHKSRIHLAKAKAQAEIEDYIDGYAQAVNSHAQYNYVQELSARVKANGYIKMHELGKLVNISDRQFRNADYRLRNTVTIVKDWLADVADDDANAIAQKRTENNSIKKGAPPISTSPLKARKDYRNAFRLVTLNLRHNVERKMESAYETVSSGLKDFTHVMFGDPKADDYLAPYSSTHTIPFIECDFQIRKIIQINKKPDMQQVLPALNPRDYQ